VVSLVFSVPSRDSDQRGPFLTIALLFRCPHYEAPGIRDVLAKPSSTK